MVFLFILTSHYLVSQKYRSEEHTSEDEKSNITLIVEEGDSNIQEEEQAPSQVVAADITSRLKMLSVQSNDENGITVEDVSDEEEEQA